MEPILDEVMFVNSNMIRRMKDELVVNDSLLLRSDPQLADLNAELVVNDSLLLRSDPQVADLNAELYDMTTFEKFIKEQYAN